MDYLFVPKKRKGENSFKSRRHINVEAPWHGNFEMEFVIATKGTVIMQIREDIYKLHEGEGCYVMPFEPHSFATENYSECHVLMFASDIIKHFFDYLADHTPDTKVFSVPSDVISLIDRFLPDELNEVEITEAMACLAPICAEIKRQITFKENKSKYDDTFIEALSIINECYTSQISLDDIAKRIGIDPATLSRKFSQKAKIPLVNYINILRCDFAATQIRETDKTFTEIAYTSGFGSIRSFNRIFRKHMNCTPSEFRQNPAETRILI